MRASSVNCIIGIFKFCNWIFNFKLEIFQIENLEFTLKEISAIFSTEAAIPVGVNFFVYAMKEIWIWQYSNMQMDAVNIPEK